MIGNFYIFATAGVIIISNYIHSIIRKGLY